MTGGLEAKINEGFVLPRFYPFPLLGFYPALMRLITAQITPRSLSPPHSQFPLPNCLEPSHF
jgi:hypothetical protein